MKLNILPEGYSYMVLSTKIIYEKCLTFVHFFNHAMMFIFGRGGSGGGDSSWHKSGSGLNKHNSIYDFVSCGNYLVNEGYVHRDQLGAIGWSAGCLLASAAMNMYPDLFRATILKVSSCNNVCEL